jgi:hypothetical protein
MLAVISLSLLDCQEAESRYEKLDRIVKDSDPVAGRKDALSYLEQSRFDVLVWGAVLKSGHEKLIPKIY